MLGERHASHHHSTSSRRHRRSGYQGPCFYILLGSGAVRAHGSGGTVGELLALVAQLVDEGLVAALQGGSGGGSVFVAGLGLGLHGRGV